jgi:urease accessory protein
MNELLKIFEKVDAESKDSVSMTLPFEKRQKHRFQASLDNGQKVGIMLPRNGMLRDGDLLLAEDGQLIRVCAAKEEVSIVEHDDEFQLMRACYHLGNRHVPLQIGNGWLRYQRDHVLDKMVKHLGLKVRHEILPFEPESGAYHHQH